MALTNQKVVGVVCRRDLHTAGSKADFHVFVGNHRNLAPNHRQNQRFANQVCVLFIVRVDGNGGIAKHGFGTGGGNLHKLAFLALDGVADMPEEAGLLAVFHLGVRKRGNAVRTPVDNAVSAVDQSFLIKVDKHLAHRAGATFVKGKALARPIAGSAQLFELTGNSCLIFIFPLPNALQKFFAPQIIAGQSLFFAQALLYLNLRGNAGVVGSGNPNGVIPLHSLIANKNILQGFVQRVPHVELSRHVGRRNDHREMLGIVFGIGRKVALFAPFGINAVLK